jgi:hypothetical protein
MHFSIYILEKIVDNIYIIKIEQGTTNET